MNLRKITWAGFILLLFLSFNPPLHASVIQYYITQGDELYRTHHLAPDRIGQAIRYYEKALAIAPNDYHLLWKLSEMYQVNGQLLDDSEKDRKISSWKKGKAFGKKAISINPEGKEGHFYYMSNMGAIVRTQGALSAILQIGKIKKAMDTAYRLDPDFPPVLIARAKYLTELPSLFGGDKHEAVKLYHRVLEMNPNSTISYYYLAELDAENQRYEEALAKLDKINSCENSNAYANCIKITRPWSEQLREKILKRKE